MARWDGGWSGEGLIDLVGSSTLDSLAVVLRRARAGTGANRCEWAKDGEIWVLQLGETISRPPLIPASRIDTDVDPLLVALARTVVRAPGLLGEELVLPWALGGLPAVSARAASTDPDVPATRELSRQLVEEVWGLPADQAIQLAERTMRELRGPDPVVALDRLHGLKTPDARPTTTLLDMVDALRARMVEMGAAPTVSAAWHMSTGDIADVIEGRGHRTLTRAGIGRWEPFVASVVLATGSLHHGTAAAGGIGAGRRAQVSSGQGMEKFPPRAVVTSPGPTPDLAPLLWDASALVTGTGSPAAHLFDSARSLGIPAVCGVDIGEDPDLIVAVDGHRATVATMSMHGAEDD
jgi:hypothetical protein